MRAGDGALSGDNVSPSEETFLSPGDLCERWRVDWKTLQKFPIPWVQLSPTVRRIDLTFVLTYEQANRFNASSS